MPGTLANVRKVYGESARVMGAALKRELGDAVEFTQPQGGLFFWARPTGKGGKVKDAGEFAKRAIEQGVAFVRAGGAVLCLCEGSGCEHVQVEFCDGRHPQD